MSSRDGVLDDHRVNGGNSHHDDHLDRRGQSSRRGDDVHRGQSHVIGVVLLLGVTTIALGGLTVAVGSIVEANAAGVDAGRVAAGFDEAFEPTETTGRGGGTVSYTDGRVETAERTIRILNDTGTVAELPANALVYESGDHRVVALTGAVVRGPPGNAVLYADPPVSVSNRALVVGVGMLETDPLHTSGGGRLTVRTTVEHDRRTLGTGSWRIAVETATPEAWRRYFDRRGATTDRRDYDGDGIESVVAHFPGERRGYLVVHHLNAEVSIRGA